MNARAATAALALFAGACAVAPSKLPELAGIPAAFEVQGRLALRDGERSEIARLRWTHRGAADLWVVSSPLGNEVARIESDSSGATLTQGSAPVHAASFADLTERALGVALVPADLARWLHGAQPVSDESGWTVTIEQTQRAGAVEIARRMSARRGEVLVRLVVDEYRALED